MSDEVGVGYSIGKRVGKPVVEMGTEATQQGDGTTDLGQVPRKIESIELHAFGDASATCVSSAVYVIVRQTHKVINRYFGCRCFKAKAVAQRPPCLLPLDRSDGTLPFQTVGVDFARPIKYLKKPKQ